MIDWTSVINWFLGPGIRILIMLLVGIGLWLALKKFVPPLVRRRVARTKK